MTFEEIYNEADVLYQQYEDQYGVYLAMELDLSYVWHWIEVHSSAGWEPEEILDSIKQMITQAADMAAITQVGEAEYEND